MATSKIPVTTMRIRVVDGKKVATHAEGVEIVASAACAGQQFTAALNERG